MPAVDTSSNPSLNEIVSSLAARVNKQHDVAFMDELKHIVQYKRAKALYAWMIQLTMRDFLFETFLAETERVSATECPEFPTTCYIVRTVCEVPDPFRDPRMRMSYEMFEYVGHQSGYQPYAYMQREDYALSRYRPYTAEKKKWFYSDGYIYIVNEKTPPEGDPERTPAIMVRGVFMEPIDDRCDICNEDGTTCKPDSAPYAVPPELLSQIIEDILKTELGVGDVPKEVDEEKDTIKVDSTENIQHQNT